MQPTRIVKVVIYDDKGQSRGEYELTPEDWVKSKMSKKTYKILKDVILTAALGGVSVVSGEWRMS